MLRSSGLSFECLYAGPLSPSLMSAAPYLVQISPDSRFFNQLIARAWEKSWGIFVVAKPQVTLQALRRHFRTLLRVRTEQGQVLAFRFYDPRVVQLYLSTCMAAELKHFMGPVDRIIMADPDNASLLELAFDRGVLTCNGSSRPAPEVAARMARTAFFRNQIQPVPVGELQSFPLKARLAFPYFRLQDDSIVSTSAHLPHHASVQEARDWIIAQRAAGELLHAVMHRGHGMIGAFGLMRKDDVASFHYWIGQPFRGLGYAKGVLTLMKAQAKDLGIARLYSAVDPDNAVSLRALLNAGFRTLGSGMLTTLPTMRGVTAAVDASSSAEADEADLLAEIELLFAAKSDRKLRPISHVNARRGAR